MAHRHHEKKTHLVLINQNNVHLSKLLHQNTKFLNYYNRTHPLTKSLRLRWRSPLFSRSMRREKQMVVDVSVNVL